MKSVKCCILDIYKGLFEYLNEVYNKYMRVL